METITLEEAQNHLPQLVHQLAAHGELLIVEADRPVARLSPFVDRHDVFPSSLSV